MGYIHEFKSWPTFRWDAGALAQGLAGVRHRQGRLVGRMEALGFSMRAEAVLLTLTQDVIKSSEIEGEKLELEQVRSSIARRLGMDIGALAATDRHVDGVVEMTLDATQRYDMPLTEERLFGWHAALFPTGRRGIGKLVVGAWRDDASGPMQVVSGPMGKERVHYEAPAAARVDAEMKDFLHWFNAEAEIDAVIKAALAHLWFVTIHPFDDGNGRIARAIADMALARSEGSTQRFYSMSSQIRLERKHYYDVLEATQTGELDVTNWLTWFLGCLDRAISAADGTLAGVLRKAKYWEALRGQPLNHRQRKVIDQMLSGFEGKMTSSKWARMTSTSPDTALRDITDLVARRILARNEAGGRGVGYFLAPP
ncbi:MAG: Fic family protein [Gemmatimonadales bacterium]